MVVQARIDLTLNTPSAYVWFICAVTKQQNAIANPLDVEVLNSYNTETRMYLLNLSASKGSSVSENRG